MEPRAGVALWNITDSLDRVYHESRRSSPIRWSVESVDGDVNKTSKLISRKLLAACLLVNKTEQKFHENEDKNNVHVADATNFGRARRRSSSATPRTQSSR